MEKFELRPATDADDEFLYDVHRRALGDAIEATWGPWDDDVQRRFHQDWFRPETVEIVLVDGRPAGMVQAAVEDADTFYISRIEIDPDLQNRGIGTAVLQHLLDHARQSGLSAVELHVLAVNRARELYERLGFHVTADEPPKLHMRLDLQTPQGRNST